MRTIHKNVYYCDFCKRHGLSSAAMTKHEQHCTLNPDRTCRWRIEGNPRQYDFRQLAGDLRRRAPLNLTDIDWLDDEVDGCPACMLAALRQSGVEYHHTDRGALLWDYDAEVKRFREEEREHWQQEERRQIEATFL